ASRGPHLGGGERLSCQRDTLFGYLDAPAGELQFVTGLQGPHLDGDHRRGQVEPGLGDGYLALVDQIGDVAEDEGPERYTCREADERLLEGLHPGCYRVEVDLVDIELSKRR